jgi:ankyrin repeat protein
MLLNRGVDPNAGFLLHDAALKGFTEIAEILISHGAKFHGNNGTGSTTIHEAALAGQTAVIELLIEKGADINVRDRETGSTPLHLAASWGRTDAVRVLLKHGADSRIASKNGVSALASAVANGHNEAAAILRESEAHE